MPPGLALAHPRPRSNERVWARGLTAEWRQQEAQRVGQAPRPCGLVVAAVVILDVLQVVAFLPTDDHQRVTQPARIVDRAAPLVVAHVEVNPPGRQLALFDQA